MSIVELKEKMKMIQNALLEFLEDESNTEENYENFLKSVTEYQITEDKNKFKSILRLINAIGSNHRRVPNFIAKLEQILSHFKKDIQQSFSNSELFQIFKDNRRILLFLFNEKLIIIDEYIILQIAHDIILCKNDIQYFEPEIKPFFTKEFIEKNRKKHPHLEDVKKLIEENKKEYSEEFFEKRKEGENDNYLCKLIRANQVKEFGIYINRNNIPVDSCIEKSIFETNQLMDDIDVSLIEYAAFYGSIDIIRYMRLNEKAEMPSNIWIHAIHSCNAELIQYLEDNHVPPPENDYDTILDESILCHHNDVSKYIIDYLIKEEDLQNNIENNYEYNLYHYAFKSYNYCFFPENMKCENMFLYLCIYDYYTLLNLYLEKERIYINAKIKISNF